MRRWLTPLLILLLAAPLQAATPTTQPDDVPPEVEAAVARGLDYLAHQQQPDGSIGTDGPKLATTALSLMAFLASGHTPDVGKHGAAVCAATEFLIKQLPDDGYFGKVDGSRMYGQGICTLALAEVYGTETDDALRARIRAALDRSLKVILTAQQVQKGAPFPGGWRYEPQSADSDLSLSGWNALALRAAQNAGMNVPKEPIGRAVAFVLRCYNAEQHGFGYQPGNESSAGMTGVGMLNLCLLDAAERPEVRAAAKFLVDHPLNDGTPMPYYTAYYMTQASFQAGEPAWSSVWRPTRERILAHQEAPGSWPQSASGQEPGRTYATAMSVLTLSVPFRLLPVYQR